MAQHEHVTRKVITVVEGEVPPERQESLVAAYEALRDLPAGLLSSHLLQDAKRPELWQIVTVWESMEALERMRATEPVPAAIVVFRDAGATPAVRVLTGVVEKP